MVTSYDNVRFSLEVTVSAPTLSGLHHVTFPVSDLPAGVSWYERVLRAEHLPGLDHYNSGGKWFAAVLALPGLDVAVQLRLTRGTPVTGGHPPVAFAVRDRAELDRWVNHLDACEVPHPPTIAARIGDSVRFASPDGTPLRIYTGSVDTDTARSADPLSERDGCHRLSR
jgi:catechol 2,3-dioxygenase-like lactoylglutathione lyase family enzyme